MSTYIFNYFNNISNCRFYKNFCIPPQQTNDTGDDDVILKKRNAALGASENGFCIITDKNVIWTDVNGGITVKSSGESSGGSMIVSGMSFTVKLEGDTSIGNVYAAIYDGGGKLKNLKQYPAADSVKVEFDAGVIGSYVKIMWWDNNMKPMCETNIIPLQ